ncbi:Hypothetical predicted protein [Prunus dulcis]|uniref:Uncharacterized protein n=1 Tax=Prunus dulcis TaxID=3755 RepID=A0A5E4GGS3_PRUDU|nr:Hypothetical predicted protein [Prunus dulcis]
MSIATRRKLEHGTRRTWRNFLGETSLAKLPQRDSLRRNSPFAELPSAELPLFGGTSFYGTYLPWDSFLPNSLRGTPFHGTPLAKLPQRDFLPRNSLGETPSTGLPSEELPWRNSLSKTPFRGTYLGETSFRGTYLQRIGDPEDSKIPP